jgi:hypothetical protein
MCVRPSRITEKEFCLQKLKLCGFHRRQDVYWGSSRLRHDGLLSSGYKGFKGTSSTFSVDFNHKDRCDTFFRNPGNLAHDHTASQHRRPQSALTRGILWRNAPERCSASSFSEGRKAQQRSRNLFSYHRYNTTPLRPNFGPFFTFPKHFQKNNSSDSIFDTCEHDKNTFNCVSSHHI